MVNFTIPHLRIYQQKINYPVFHARSGISFLFLFFCFTDCLLIWIIIGRMPERNYVTRGMLWDVQQSKLLVLCSDHNGHTTRHTNDLELVDVPRTTTEQEGTDEECCGRMATSSFRLPLWKQGKGVASNYVGWILMNMKIKHPVKKTKVL
jgi:hypothetical protein